MTPTPTSSPASVAVDASVAVALCAKEPGSYDKVKAYLDANTANGSKFFAPGVLVSEVLFVLCKKLANGALTAAEHAQAVLAFNAFMAGISPPPNGDNSLILRAEQIRSGYVCNRSSDGIYLALAEELTKAGATEIVTLDEDMPKQAKKNAAGVNVILLK